MNESKPITRMMLNLPPSLAERLAFEAELALLRPSQSARALIAAALPERRPEADE